MPIKSKAQRRKFAELLVKGEISPETFEEWTRAAGSAELPERLHPKAVAVGPLAVPAAYQQIRGVFHCAPPEWAASQDN